MARMLCKCGEIMGTSVSPSPYIIYVYYEQEVRSAIAENPKIQLTDFLSDWDEVNREQKKFMKRSEPVEYWYCTECQRVYETQAKMGGHWLRAYQRVESQPQNVSFEDWTRIYILKDVETDAALEEAPRLLLSDYLEMHIDICYFIASDERTVIAASTDMQNVQFAYIQEEIAE